MLLTSSGFLPIEASTSLISFGSNFCSSSLPYSGVLSSTMKMQPLVASCLCRSTQPLFYMPSSMTSPRYSTSKFLFR